MPGPPVNLRILFPAHPLERREPDPSYCDEAGAVDELGLARAVIRVEPLLERGDVQAAVRGVPAREAGPSLYRGWMLPPDRYASLHAALAARGDQLLNSPAAYRHTHWLPESYAAIEPWTARTAWLPAHALTLDAAVALARTFGTVPLIVKDYVKSRKHEWAEACFIPSAADEPAVRRVVQRFLELTGTELQGGLVLREFIELELVGDHARSGMPLAREWRTFWLDHEPILIAPYWPEVAGEPPPVASFAQVAAKVESRFFTMDLARRRSGDWIIVELGDGQVAGLPDGVDPQSFYRAIASRQAVRSGS